MADEPWQPPKGMKSSSPASPGISGAIKDAMGALSSAFSPKSMTQRGKKLDDTIDAESAGNAPKSLGDSF